MVLAVGLGLVITFQPAKSPLFIYKTLDWVMQSIL